MAPKAAAKTGEKLYDEITVIGLLLTIKHLGGTHSKILGDLSALDGKRSTSSFEHSLRAANKVASELYEKQKKGEKITPADLGRDEDGNATAAVITVKASRKRKGVITEDGEGMPMPMPKKTRVTRANKNKGGKMVDSGAEEDDEDNVKAADVEDEVIVDCLKY